MTQRSQKRMPGFVGHVHEDGTPRLYVVLCRIEGVGIDMRRNRKPGFTHSIATYRLTDRETGWWNHEEAGWWNHEELDGGASR